MKYFAKVVLTSILSCCFVIGFCQKNVDIFNGYKYVFMPPLTYKNGGVDIYGISSVARGIFMEKGFVVFANKSDSDIPQEAFNNPCVVLTCYIEHPAPNGLNNSVALSEQMDRLSGKLGTAPIHEIVHHHYIPRIIFGTILLAVILCMVCAGWFYTERKLDGFIANDTKYRALKLDTAIHPLQQYLERLDSEYAANSDMRDKVLQQEQEYLDNFYRVQKALLLKEEARKLEKEAGRK